MPPEPLPHVLALDDDAAVRDMVAEYLGQNDFRVTTCAMPVVYLYIQRATEFAEAVRSKTGKYFTTKSHGAKPFCIVLVTARFEV